PFTPCQGPRLLVASPEQGAELIKPITLALAHECQAQHYSSWHCLFPDEQLSAQLQQQGAAQRLGCQFHWFNKGYKNFDDFVATMNSRKRKNILKERRQVQEQGFAFRVKTGAQLNANDWVTFYALYRTTYLKRSGHSGY